MELPTPCAWAGTRNKNDKVFLGDRKNPGAWQQPRSRGFNLGDDLLTIRRQRITDPESGVYYTGYAMKRETGRLVELYTWSHRYKNRRDHIGARGDGGIHMMDERPREPPCRIAKLRFVCSDLYIGSSRTESSDDGKVRRDFRIGIVLLVSRRETDVSSVHMKAEE